MIDLQQYPGYNFIYASVYRPINQTWAVKLPKDAILIDNRLSTRPHTWILTREELPANVIKTYELEEIKENNND